MTFESSNSYEYEHLPTQAIINIIRSGMEAGCIEPCHLYDAVDEALCRLAKNENCNATYTE